MTCEHCDVEMESCGYGDERCPDCGHMEYSESEEDFYERLNRNKPE